MDVTNYTDEVLHAAKEQTEARVRDLRQRLADEERHLEALRRETYRRVKHRPTDAPAERPEDDGGPDD